MPRGISLHVGINQYSSAFPGAGPLTGPENDAREMEKIAEANHFEVRDLLVGSDATYARVTTKIRSAAVQLEKDDIFLFTFAGHGFQRVDSGNDPDETSDGLDETILLFDVELFDDVLRQDLWPSFKPGVRVLMIADSCHSESVFLIPGETANIDDFPVATHGHGRIRNISDSTHGRHLAEYGEFYRNISLPVLSPPITASLMLLAACEARDVTLDGDPNGMYTAAMLDVLKNSDPADYDALVKGIQTVLTNAGRNQKPTIEVAGAGPDFRGQKPFTIN